MRSENVVYFLYDLETTGKYSDRCVIVEIAVKVVSNSKKFLDGDKVWVRRVKPTHPIPLLATKVHGLRRAVDHRKARHHRKVFDWVTIFYLSSIIQLDDFYHGR
jgi:DNA polymerase III epsilon subunit-like protein